MSEEETRKEAMAAHPSSGGQFTYPSMKKASELNPGDYVLIEMTAVEVTDVRVTPTGEVQVYTGDGDLWGVFGPDDEASVE